MTNFIQNQKLTVGTEYGVNRHKEWDIKLGVNNMYYTPIGNVCFYI